MSGTDEGRNEGAAQEGAAQEGAAQDAAARRAREEAEWQAIVANYGDRPDVAREVAAVWQALGKFEQNPEP